jgi:hypothetical protein
MAYGMGMLLALTRDLPRAELIVTSHEPVLRGSPA